MPANREVFDEELKRIRSKVVEMEDDIACRSNELKGLRPGTLAYKKAATSLQGSRDTLEAYRQVEDAIMRLI